MAWSFKRQEKQGTRDSQSIFVLHSIYIVAGKGNPPNPKECKHDSQQEKERIIYAVEIANKEGKESRTLYT